jgi:transcriptional regulator with XRE-family HTH domain
MSDDSGTDFRCRLKAIMLQRGLTQSDLAAMMWGRSRNAKGALVANRRDRLSVWLSGKSLPSRENLDLVARTLKVAPDELASNAELLSAGRAPTRVTMTLVSDGQAMVDIHQIYPLKRALAIMDLAGTVKENDMDELQMTVETLIDLDEPEAILPTLRRAARRRKGERWQALARALVGAEAELDRILNATPADPDAAEAADSGTKSA